MQPLVSILCITYNHKDFISQAIEGFLMQNTTFPFEVLIHDDASTDGTSDIVRAYEKKYPEIIKPIYQKENQFSKGVKISLTYQYPRAQGKYLAFCEGDDYWIDPNKLQKQVDLLEKSPEIALCYHAVKQVFIGAFTEVNKLGVIESGDLFDADRIWDNWTIQTGSIMLRSAIVKEKLFKLHSSNAKMYFGDMFLILSANEYGRVVGMSEVMSIYRKHPSSLTAYGSNPSVKEMSKMLNYISFIGSLFNGRYRRQCNRYYAYKSFRYAYVCKDQHLSYRSFMYLLKSLLSSPNKFHQLLKQELNSKFKKKA